MSFYPIKKKQPTIADNGTVIQYNINYSRINEIKNHFSRKMLKNADLLTAPDGYYTWILKPAGFFAIQTITKQELGTLHVNLDFYTSNNTSADKVLAAGEMKITTDSRGRTILFNLQSGTYMEKLFRQTPELERSALQQSLIETVQSTLGSYGIAAQFAKCQEGCHYNEILGGQFLLEPANIRTSSENIATLNRLFVRKTRRGRRNRKSSKSRKNRKHRRF